jgi:hypothetical protein
MLGYSASGVRSPTRTSTEVRSPTRTSTEVRSPTRTSTWANTRGNFTSTVTGGAGSGATSVTINVGRYKRIPFAGGPTPRGTITQLEGFLMSKIARIPVSTGPKGVPGLVSWVRMAHPAVYRQLAMRLRTARLNGWGDQTVRGFGSLGFALPDGNAQMVTASDPVAVASSTPSMAQTIVSSLKDLVSVGLPLYQQNKIFDLQIKRAQAGLAPLDTSTVADLSAVRVGVDSATRNTGLMIAGAAVLGLVGYKLLSRR